MSEAIIGRIDEMGNRIDDLEKSIGELMQQAGVEDGSDLQGNNPAAGAAGRPQLTCGRRAGGRRRRERGGVAGARVGLSSRCPLQRPHAEAARQNDSYATD